MFLDAHPCKKKKKKFATMFPSPPPVLPTVVVLSRSRYEIFFHSTLLSVDADGILTVAMTRSRSYRTPVWFVDAPDARTFSVTLAFAQRRVTVRCRTRPVFETLCGFGALHRTLSMPLHHGALRSGQTMSATI
jgi:hypothetical protein